MSFSPFDEWHKRRRTNWFSDIDYILREMERFMQEAMRNAQGQFSKDFVREKKLDDGSIVREMRPIVYGYTIKIGEDGKPIIRKFGNIDAKPGFMGGISVTDEREPLTDIIRGKNTIDILVEIPGVNKEDIKVMANEGSVTITCTSEETKYSKRIELPEDADIDTGKSTYRNGILQISFNKKSSRNGGVSINVQ